ncbi:MAG: hypothetical protein V4751_07050 [Pseudomonadota bacterium]
MRILSAFNFKLTTRAMLLSALASHALQAAEVEHAVPSATSTPATTAVSADLSTAAPTGESAKAATESTRLWLPESAQHLHQFLEMAVAQALQDANCTEVLYGRLNEYRTIYEEPTFTVLCKKDYKTTFNKVYHITELDPNYNNRIAESQATTQLTQGLNAEIEALRQQLTAPEQPAAPTATVELLVPMDEDPNDLSLDLDIEPDTQ